MSRLRVNRSGWSCAVVCSQFYGDAEDACNEGSSVVTAWPTEADCTAACEAQTEVAPFAFFGCMMGVDCDGDPAGCTSLATEPDPVCAAGCAEVFELCPDGLGAFSDADGCAAFCTGMLAGTGAEPSPAAATCIEALGTCPDGDSGMGQVFGCIFGGGGPVDASPTCQFICGTTAACAGEPGLPSDCLQGCGMAEIEDPTFVTTIAMCVSAAGEDCDAVQACLPEDEGE